MASVFRRDEQGASAVEFALVVPIFLMLVFGLVTCALAYNDSLSINNAAREGSRLGAALDYVSDPPAWADSVQTRVQQTYFNEASTLSSSQICVQLVTNTGTLLASPTTQGSSCGNAPTSPSNMQSGTCVIKVWLQKPATISIGVVTFQPINISAMSVSYYGRTSGACSAI